MRKIIVFPCFFLVTFLCCGVSFAAFMNNGDNTITDTNTGLMWQKEAPGSTMNWEGPITYCENLSLAGHNDWRLPTIKELTSIVNLAKYNLTIDTQYFLNTVLSCYWSSTTYAGSTSPAWVINFWRGYDHDCNKSYDYSVRAVRGGQNRLLGHLLISTPAQGARWGTGSEHVITWDTQAIPGNVKISLSRHGGKEDTFEPIAESTENHGAYAWTVTGPESFNCVLKIEPLSAPSKGTTQGLFSICALNNTFMTAHRTGGGPDKYRLTLKGVYADGVAPIEALKATWSCSDPNVATLEGNMLTGQQNGRVDASATYMGKACKKGLFVYTSFEAVEIENNNTKDDATLMTDGTFYKGGFYEGDIDYYQFTLSSDSVLDIGYLSYSTTSDMRVEVYDAGDTLMASAISTCGDFLTFPSGLPAGTYHLKLSSAGDVDQENYYVVTYKVLHDLVAKSTVPLAMGETGQSGINHLEDESNFAFTLPEKQGVKVLFTPTGGLAKYHIELLDSSQTVIDQVECLNQVPVTTEAIYVMPRGTTPSALRLLEMWMPPTLSTYN